MIAQANNSSGAVWLLAIVAAMVGAGAGGAAVFLLLRWQMRRVIAAVRNITQGQLDARTDLHPGVPAVGELANAIDRMAEALQGQAGLQRQLEQTLQDAYDNVKRRAQRRSLRLKKGVRHLNARVGKLKESQSRYRAVISRTADGFFLANADNKRVLEFNVAFRRLLGYTSAETRELTVYDIAMGDRQGIDASVAQSLSFGEDVFLERQFRRKDGSAVDVELSISVLFYRNREVLCAVVHDISERKKAEARLQQQNQKLADAARAEREAMEELQKTQSRLVQSEKLAGLGQMVAGVAHEINNPLAFVSNNIAILQRDVQAIFRLLELYKQAESCLAEAQPQLLASVKELSDRVDLPYTMSNLPVLLARSREGLKRIQQIVIDLRDFARLDESDLSEINLNTGIESTVNIAQGHARKKHVRIELDLQPLPIISCWPAKINQVVMNLLANAIDASRDGEAVIIRTRPNSAGVEFDVIDHGCGIAPDIRGRIFDPFFTTKPIGEGTGLGLSISYGIVQDHGGVLQVESELGKGSRFTVHLPLHPPVHPAPVAPAAAAAKVNS